jgi:hypothetical protein
VLRDEQAVTRLLAARPAARGLRTRLSHRFLEWRYGSSLLEYRAIVAPGGIERGVALFRVRRRGRARECALGDVIVADGDADTRRELVHRVARSVDADYVIAIDPRFMAPGRLVRLPTLGPLLTWRAIAPAGMPPLGQWDLRLGDVELF